MKNRNHLAIDMGSSTTRVILFESNDELIILKKVIHRFENKIIHENNNLFWDHEDILKNMIEGINKVDVPISSLGIDGWGVDFAYLDDNHKILDKVFTYRDPEAQEAFKDLKDNWFINTGVTNDIINTSTQILRDNKIRPHILKQARYILNIADLFNFLLTNQINNEYSISKTTQLLNHNTNLIDEAIKEKLNIDHISFKPNIAGQILGDLHESVIHNKNLIGAKVISVAGHDTASALVPLKLKSNDIFIALGSWVVVGTSIEKPIINENVEKFGLSNEGNAFGGIKLLKNVNGLYLLQKAKKELNIDFPELISLAIQGKNQNYFNPNDSIILDESITLFERIKKYCISNNMEVFDKKEEVLKMIYNSLTHTIKETIENLVKVTSQSPSKIVIFGGGIQDKYLIKLLEENLSSIAEIKLGPIESTSIGNAIIQSVQTDYKKIEKIKIIEEN